MAPRARKTAPAPAAVAEGVTPDKFLELLASPQADVQAAAAIVVGELKLDDSRLREALAKLLREGRESARVSALDALERLGGDLPMDAITTLLASPGDLGRRAQEIVARQGAGSIPQLVAQIKDDTPLSVSRSVVSTLARATSLEAVEALLSILPKFSTDLQRAASDDIARIVGGLSKEDAEKAHAAMEKLVDDADPKKDVRTLVTGLHLLRRARHPAPGAIYLKHAAKTFPPEIRSAALVGLSEVTGIPEREHVNVFQKLLPALEEEDFDRLVRPALVTLGRLPMTRTMSPALEKLNRSRHRSVRAYALRALGSIGQQKSTKTLLEALGAEERKVFESASDALGSNPNYIPNLISALKHAKTSEEAWRIAAVLGRHREGIAKPQLKEFAQKALQLAETRTGPFSAYFELLRASAPDLLRETFTEAGRKLVTQKLFPKAINVLRHLDRQDLARPDSDILLALAYLETGDQHTTRDRHPGLAILSRLARDESFKIALALKPLKKVLDPEAILAAGVYFAERVGVEHNFGVEILKFVRESHPKSVFGDRAAAKLKAERVR